MALAMLAAVAGDASARIGDAPEQMSARILQPDLGKNFSWPKDMNEKERARQEKENPVNAFAYLLPTSPEEWRTQIFWKSAVKTHLSNENGWRIHVHFMGGRSVLELYRRVGESLSDAEVNAILARMRGAETWRKVERKDNVSSVVGYDFELGEEAHPTLRARKLGDWLMIFPVRFDVYLVERKKRWDDSEAVRKEAVRKTQAELAPQSVEGF